MTLLDLMIDVGGLTDYAAGNKAVLVRTFGDERTVHELRLEDLLEDGDISADMALYPGDIVMIPEAWF
jgi:polysaccharide export outer membrane protein